MAKLLLTLKEVAELLDVSQSTMRNLVKDGRFPGPVKVTARVNKWLYSDVESFLRSLEIERQENSEDAPT